MLKISELGLVQMTRKRTRESLEELLTEQCPQCQGRRVVKSVPTLAAEVLRGIHREAGRRRATICCWSRSIPTLRAISTMRGRANSRRSSAGLASRSCCAPTESIEAGAFELTQADRRRINRSIARRFTLPSRPLAMAAAARTSAEMDLAEVELLQ